jgi:hypothetical protein
VNQRERVKLLHGPYTPPPLKRGDRATCLLRDCDVIITGWSAGRIAWPRCRAEGTHGGGSGILLNEELARAVRCEAAAAIRYWWGVSVPVVWRWRKALGVGLMDSEGSRRLILDACQQGAALCRGKTLPPEQVERRRTLAQAHGARLRNAWTRERACGTPSALRPLACCQTLAFPRPNLSAFLPHSFRIIAETPHFSAISRNRPHALANKP